MKARIKLRIGMIGFLCHKGLAPSYLISEITPISTLNGRERLRSASSNCFAVPLTRCPNLGGRAFSAMMAATWNRVPSFLKNTDSLSNFKKHFKEFLLQNDLYKALKPVLAITLLLNKLELELELACKTKKLW